MAPRSAGARKNASCTSGCYMASGRFHFHLLTARILTESRAARTIAANQMSASVRRFGSNCFSPMHDSPTTMEIPSPAAERAPDPHNRSDRARLTGFRRSWMVRDVLLPFLATRLMLSFVGWLALLSFQNLPAIPGSWELKPSGEIAVATPYLSTTSYPLLNIYSRWDGGWYHSIAKNGYRFEPGKQSNTAFFPLYPMLMRVVHAIIPSETDAGWVLAGCIVSNCALFIALCYLLLLLRIDLDHETAARAVLYLLVFPTAFFFSAVYSESVFLATTVAAFYYARTGKWWIAGALAGAATLSRSPGILLGAPLLLEYLLQRRFQWREIRPDILSLGIIPASLAAHMLYLRWSVGNLMAIQDAQAAWGGEWGTFSSPWTPVIRFAREPFMFNDVMNFAFAAAMLVLVILAVLRLRPSYGLYAITGFWFITSWSTFESMPRYVLVIFPAFVILAKWGRNPMFDRAYVVLASGLAAVFMMRFALWRWVA